MIKIQTFKEIKITEQIVIFIRSTEELYNIFKKRLFHFVTV